MERAIPVVAGASAAGMVGGALFAVPAFLSLVSTTGPFVALPVAAGLFGVGAAFGGFLGELAYTRIGTSLAVGGLAGGGAIVGSSLGALGGGLLGGAIGAATARPGSFDDLAGVVLGGLAGAAVGGLASSSP